MLQQAYVAQHERISRSPVFYVNGNAGSYQLTVICTVTLPILSVKPAP